MARNGLGVLEEPQHPRRVDGGSRVRAGPQGLYRQTADGLIVRLATVESAHEAEVTARALLDLAVRDAAGQ